MKREQCSLANSLCFAMQSINEIVSMFTFPFLEQCTYDSTQLCPLKVGMVIRAWIYKFSVFTNQEADVANCGGATAVFRQLGILLCFFLLFPGRAQWTETILSSAWTPDLYKIIFQADAILQLFRRNRLRRPA